MNDIRNNPPVTIETLQKGLAHLRRVGYVSPEHPSLYWVDMLNRIGPEGVEGLIDETVNLLDSPNDTDQKEDNNDY